MRGAAYLPCGQIEGIGDSYNRRHHVLLLEVVSYTSTELHICNKKGPAAKCTLSRARRKKKASLICKDLQLLSLEIFWNIL